MKTVTKREFYRTPALARSLRSGESVVVTDQGEPSFVVMKPGKAPQRSTEELVTEAEAILPGERRRVNVVGPHRGPTPGAGFHESHNPNGVAEGGRNPVGVG